MLYLFSGDDSKNKLIAYEKFIKALPTSVEKFFINRSDFDFSELENFYSGAGLFSPEHAIMLSNVFERKETRDFILKNIASMGTSTNSFVFLDGSLAKPILEAFKKNKAEINSFELPKAKKEKFNNFLLVNAFGAKDKLNLWIYYRMAVDKGVGLEELVGVLFWKMKDMFLKKDFNKFSREQLENFITKISYLLPEARKQGRDAEIAFEEFLLKAF